MTGSQFDDFLIYATGLCLLMAALNVWLVFKRGRSWAMVVACLLAAVTLVAYHFEAPRPILILFGAGVIGALVLDALHRASNTPSGGPKA